MKEGTDQSLNVNPEAGKEFRRVLSLRDLVIFGIAFVGPTAPYSMFGIATVKSLGHLSRLALGLGALWMAAGFIYLLWLTRGLKKQIIELKTEIT